MPVRLTAEDCLGIARQYQVGASCPSCAVLRCLGWEAFPASVKPTVLRELGALWLAGDDEPCLDEHHPAGTHYWSSDAPIALAFHPYNRCTLWQCSACARPFLRYTEYGGYYEEARIRELRAELIV